MKFHTTRNNRQLQKTKSAKARCGNRPLNSLFFGSTCIRRLTAVHTPFIGYTQSTDVCGNVGATKRMHFHQWSAGHSPKSTKKPRLQKKPDRKELKGKVPTQSMYTNCVQQTNQHGGAGVQQLFQSWNVPHLDDDRQEGVNQECVNHLHTLCQHDQHAV